MSVIAPQSCCLGTPDECKHRTERHQKVMWKPCVDIKQSAGGHLRLCSLEAVCLDLLDCSSNIRTQSGIRGPPAGLHGIGLSSQENEKVEYSTLFTLLTLI